MEESVCLWLTDGNLCNGKIEQRVIFNKQLTVEACDRHYTNHVNIMVLASKDYDIEKILEMNEDDIQEKVDRLVAAGFDIETFEA